MEFINTKNKHLLTINHECSILTINDNGIKKYNITKVYFCNENNGKFETEEFIIKFSKKRLYVYTKDIQRDIIGEYKFSRYLTDTIENNKDTELIKQTFIIKKNKFIDFYKVIDSGKEKYYFIQRENNGDGTKENVIDIQYSGNDTIYIGEYNNKLYISGRGSSGKYKWNGIPIGLKKP